MLKLNSNFSKFQQNYLFVTVRNKVNEYKAMHPEKDVISLGIGDVTQPLVPAVIDAMHRAVDEMGKPTHLRVTARILDIIL